MDELKQVIVIRKDLNMRKGKMVAQGAHASLLAVLEMLEIPNQKNIVKIWLREGMTKICVSVDSQDELNNLYANLVASNIPVSLVIDAGYTEFHGKRTNTCLAIGPWYANEIDKFTGNLKLL